MEISAKELRGKPTQIIEQAARGTDIVITIRGKRLARLIPYFSKIKAPNKAEEEDLIFGMWQERDTAISVDEQIRNIRKGRSF